MRTASLLFLAAASVLSFCLTLLVRRLAGRLDFLDRPGERKTHPHPVPYGGGIAIFLTVALLLVSAALAVLYCHRHGRPWWLGEGIFGQVREHLSGAAAKLPQLAAVLVGGFLIFLLGLMDDRKKLGPLTKLAVQTLVAGLLAALGVRVTAFLDSELLGAALTVVWIVGITNAFNFMDNMDGLSAGVALITAVIFLVVAGESGQLFIAASLIPFIGALIGFLPFNYAPATIFMGDAGSLFIGYFLAVLSVLFTFYEGPAVSFRPFVLPLIIFAVPIYDSVSVTILRLKEGRSPFAGDRRHLSHRLVELGLTERLAVAAIHLLTLGIGLAAILLYLARSPFGETVAILQTLALLAAVAVIERAIRS
jgi:UDP-GlcNAc:undecaprenyl-phosphate GlcNAc-1-phosphate transferase